MRGVSVASVANEAPSAQPLKAIFLRQYDKDAYTLKKNDLTGTGKNGR